MPSVNIRDNESFDVALRRFKRICEKAGVPTKLRQLEFYEEPTAKRKRKRAAAVKRYQKKLQKENEVFERGRTRRPPVITPAVEAAEPQVAQEVTES